MNVSMITSKTHLQCYTSKNIFFSRRSDDGRRTPEPHFKNPRVAALFTKWRQVWLVSMDRSRRLQEALDYLNEVC